MKQISLVMMLAVMLIAGTATAADYTPLHAEMTNAVTVEAALTIADAQTITFVNDEVIGNASDAALDITFDDDAVVLGNVDLKTSISYTNIAAGDEMTIRCCLPNDSNVVQTVATIVFDYTDETVDTEDGSILFKVQVNSTDTTILTLDSSGATLAAGSFVGSGAGLTSLPFSGMPGVTTNITLNLVGATNVLSFTNGVLGSHVLNP